MLYILAIFCPPLYFLVKKKFGRFVITAIGYVGVPFLIVLPPVAVVLALSLVFSALHDLRKEQVKQDAEVLATQIAEKMAIARGPGLDPVVVQPVPSLTPPPSVREESLGLSITSLGLSASPPAQRSEQDREAYSFMPATTKPASRFCGECRAPQEPDASFCADCGAPL
jgi:hypothetical protein